MKSSYILVVTTLFPVISGQSFSARVPIDIPFRPNRPNTVGVPVVKDRTIPSTPPPTAPPTESPILIALTTTPPQIKTTISTTTARMFLTKNKQSTPDIGATIGVPVFTPRTVTPPIPRTPTQETRSSTTTSTETMSIDPTIGVPVTISRRITTTPPSSTVGVPVTKTRIVTANPSISESVSPDTKKSTTISTTTESLQSTSSKIANRQLPTRLENSTGAGPTENSSKYPATKRVEPFDPVENTRTVPIPASSTQENAVNRTLSNSTATGVFVTVSGLCGYPPYNNRTACLRQDYFSDTLSNCEKEGGRILFGSFVGLAGAAIIFVNVLIPAVFAKNSDMRSHYDYIKVSLAIANGLTGCLMMFSVLPNMMWVRNLTEEEVVIYARNDENSATAILVGSLVTVTTHGSLLHLCFLSIERFMTIKWTFWHISRRTRSIVTSLVVIWIISVLFAFVPAVFPDHFSYQFQPVLLIHTVTTKVNNATSEAGHQNVIYNALVLALPYTIMVIFCILTGIVSYRKLRSTARFFGQDHTSSSNAGNTLPKSDQSTLGQQNKKMNARPEIAIFVTILIMIGAFTVTTLPFGIVTGLFSNGVLNCGNYTIPYVATFYFGLLNSLMNGLIYSVRDARFRSAVKRLFRIDKIRSGILMSSKDCESSRL